MSLAAPAVVDTATATATATAGRAGRRSRRWALDRDHEPDAESACDSEDEDPCACEPAEPYLSYDADMSAFEDFQAHRAYGEVSHPTMSAWLADSVAAP